MPCLSPIPIVPHTGQRLPCIWASAGGQPRAPSSVRKILASVTSLFGTWPPLLWLVTHGGPIFVVDGPEMNTLDAPRCPESLLFPIPPHGNPSLPKYTFRLAEAKIRIEAMPSFTVDLMD